MEKILCAAIWYQDEDTPVHTVKNCFEGGVVLCGFRHSNIIGQYLSLTGKRTIGDGYEQGFLTSENRFVGREEALQIALRSNQVLDPDKIRGNKLYSEDLY